MIVKDIWCQNTSVIFYYHAKSRFIHHFAFIFFI